MKPAHFFIDHPRFAAVLGIFITIAGLVTMVFLPIAQYPSIVPPTIDITTNFPGANADPIARTVATPIERPSTASRPWIASPANRPATAH